MRPDPRAAAAQSAALLAGAIGVGVGGWLAGSLGAPGLFTFSLVLSLGSALIAIRGGALGRARANANRGHDASDEAAQLDGVAAVLRALDPPLILLDLGGNVRVFNDSASRLLGVDSTLAQLDDWPAGVGLRALREAEQEAFAAPEEYADLEWIERDDRIAWIRSLLGGQDQGTFPVRVHSREHPFGRPLTVHVCRGQVPSKGEDLVLLLFSDASQEEAMRVQLREHESRRILRDTIAADVNSGMAIEHILEHTVEHIHELFPYLRISYASVDERARLRVLHSEGPPGLPSIAGLELDLTRLPNYLEVLMTREALIVADVDSEPWLSAFADAARGERTRSLVDVPLRHSETLRGVLCFDAAEPYQWTDHEVASLRTAADGLAIALGDAHRQQERMRTREQIRHASRHDPLTGLPNRAQISARVGELLRRREQHPDQRFALLFLDLDHFQVVNDGLGHAAGDRLLVSLANRLRRFAAEHRPGNTGPIPLPARLGGDEFVLLIEGLREPDEVEEWAEQLQGYLSEPHNIGGREVTATASIGIVLDDGNYDSPEALLRDADSAMYGAKRAGKAQHAVFDNRMHSAAIARLQLERDLRRAVDRGEFVAHYQPVIDLRHLRLAGFESLMRWEHPETGLVPPNEFIPLAEELGLIEPMGEWILRESAQQLVSWRNELGANDLVMHVNVSRRQLMQRKFSSIVQEIVRETGIEPSLLKLEVTETTVMSAPQEISVVLRGLREQGFPLCMDDFGTGQSSLAALLSFPIDVLKVDRGFVRNIEGRREYAAVTEAIVILAHSLGMSVVAEGVEKRADLEIIRELQCDQAQGFYFSRPLPKDAAEEYLRESLANGGQVRLPDED